MKVLNTLPNLLTLSRIVLIPVIVACFYLPVWWANLAAAIVFWVAGVTDWLDGWLARRLGQTSRFGAFLDPVADKVMVVVVLVLIVQRESTPWVVLPALVIVSREIIISALREWMAELGQRAAVAVSMVGKFKTATQMGALFFLLINHDYFGIPFQLLGVSMLQIAAALTLWSMVVYLHAAWWAVRDSAD
jgi:CDP-diacylglycerol--glycerol-3-phosphate 3-phosphatidyltransferase